MNLEESLDWFGSTLEKRGWVERPNQRESIEKIVNWFNDDGRAVLYCAPTGAGKTIVNIAVAEGAASAYYVTGNLSLQDQIIEDRFEDVCDIRGRSNYECRVTKDGCDEGLCVLKKNYKCKEDCEYKVAKDDAVNARIALSNIFYFILEGGRSFGKRELLIIDEGHNLPEDLVGFGSVKLTKKNLGEDLYMEIRSFDESALLREGKKAIRNEIDMFEELEDLSKDDINMHKKLVNVEKRMENCEECGDYVVEKKKFWVEIEPIKAAGVAKRLIFNRAEKVLISSATINPFMMSDELDLREVLGKEKTKYFTVPSTFPPERRPIYLRPVCNFKYANQISDNEEAIVREIYKIISEHKGEKGIVFTQGYRYVEMIENGVDTKNDGDVESFMRLIVHEKNNRKEVLRKWMNRFDDSVLVGVRMEEGLDLKYDMARFAICFKAPFADSSNNARVKERVQMGHWNWYFNVAQQVLIQMCGRIMRAEDDYGEMHILDEGACKLLKRKGTPLWVKEALVE